MSREMTEADLLAAVAEYHEELPLFVPGDGSMTVRELAEQRGVSTDVAQRIFKAMVADGRLEVGRRRVQTNGGSTTVPAYKLKG